eukprot:7871255-Alexandrium_andersonii.AAC.1
MDLLDASTYAKLCKLRSSAGHPNNQVLSRCLREAGAREEVWRAARHLRCHARQRLRRPEFEPITKLQSETA